ncbi:MAG TPA: hypothetical protein VK695_01945 [Steroidobacteraceae bacterium]|jgi:hypothetical protein|nr:hypothetical protein [Steroidobacteraceae bacterium]
MPPLDCPELRAFVHGERDPGHFPHREHLRMGFELLRRHDFALALQLYSQALRAMTARAGKPQVFNQTITVAFLSLLAERLQGLPGSDFAQLLQAFPELLDKGALASWYSSERLSSRAARDTFLLPDRLPARR